MEEINILIASSHRAINNAFETAVLDVCYNQAMARFTRTASLTELARHGRSGGFRLILVAAAHVMPTKLDNPASLILAVTSTLQVIRAHASTPLMAVAASDAQEEALQVAGVNKVLRFPFDREALRADVRRALKLPKVSEEPTTPSGWFQPNLFVKALQLLKST
jgi:hypothetical protein